MEERKLIGKLKRFKHIIFCFISLCLAIVCCYGFIVPKNLSNVFADDDRSLKNIEILNIQSTTNSSSSYNKSLIKKGTAEFVDGKIYVPSKSNDANAEMKFFVSETSFGVNNSLFMWVYIPDLTIQDLKISLFDKDDNFLNWNLRGGLLSTANYELSFYDMLLEYEQYIKKGWKLLELSYLDAKKQGNLSKISSISIQYSYDNEYKIFNDFSVINMFVADRTNSSSGIIDKQDFVVYADKMNVLDERTNFYIGESITLNSARDFFEYVIIGKQNILDDLSGYTWNIVVTKPSGNDVLTFSKKQNIAFAEKGYYSIDFILTTLENATYPIVSKDYRFFSENFVFGYFQKSNNNFIIGSNNVLELTISDDFVLDENTLLDIQILDNEIICLNKYEIIGNKAYITVSAEKLGTTTISVVAKGKKIGETQTKNYKVEISSTVVDVPKQYNETALWVVFGVLMAGFVVYLIILFVKSRRFGVN